jgi:hypothetical protein
MEEGHGLLRIEEMGASPLGESTINNTDLAVIK